jgi:hypothetical protein
LGDCLLWDIFKHYEHDEHDEGYALIEIKMDFGHILGDF